MPSAQDPFYVVKQEIQESVSIFYFPKSPRFRFRFNLDNKAYILYFIDHAMHLEFLHDFSVTGISGSVILRDSSSQV